VNRPFPIIKFILTVSCLLLTVNSFSQGTQEKFGQNRVQYKKFTWSYFESKNFVTYFYLGGQETGKYAVQYAEKVLPEIETMFDYKIGKRVEVLIYNDLSDLNQTNIGYGEETFNISGQVRFIKNKIFIYFNGNHQELERQIRQGIAQVILSHMMFGSSFTEVLQNAVMMHMPEWYITGLTSYVGKNWDADKDDRLKDGILTGRFKKSNRLRGEEATFFGHAFWHYVEEKYGSATVTNLIYLTRSSRSLDNSFTFVLGANLKTVLSEMYDYYYTRFAEEKENKQIPDVNNIAAVKIRSERYYSQLKMNEDGKKIAYASNNLGAWKVHLKNLETGKKKKIVKGGFKTKTVVTDYQYPLMAWSPDNKTLAVIYERRDKTRMVLYDSEAKKKERSFITKFQQVHDFSFTDNPKTLVMSAVNRGHSDVYVYAIPSTTIQQLTTDHFDDLHVSFFKSDTHRGVLFSSNRDSDTLTTRMLDSTTHSKNYDIYFYDLNTSSSVLTKLTNTVHTSEIKPQQYSDKYFSYINEENGIKNRYLGYFKNILARYDTVVFFRDSIVTNPQWNLDSLKNTANNNIDSSKVLSIFKDVGEVFPQTNYVSNIVEEDISMRAGKSAIMFLIDYKPRFFIEPLDTNVNEFLPAINKTEYGKFNTKLFEQEQKKLKAEAAARAAKMKRLQPDVATTSEEDTVVEEVDEPVLFFQSEFNTAPEINVRFVKTAFAFEEMDEEEIAEPVFRFNKVRPYQLKFATDFVSAQLFDNSLIVTRYQKFYPGFPVFNNPASANVMIKLGVVNLFEDYRITGGFRVPMNFKESEYFLAFETLKKRWDKKVMYYRRVQRSTYDSEIPFYGILPQVTPIEAKQVTNYFDFQLNYAIDVLSSFRNSFAYRNERTVFLATDQISLNIPPVPENWLFYRAEYVFDKTLPLGLNTREGFRFKAFGEIHKDFKINDKRLFDKVDVKLPGFTKNYLGVFGFDARYYLKLHKEMIWANRLAFGGSFGTQKLIYYLGGADAWLMPEFDITTPVNSNNNYAFQTIVTNMRGFKQNVRNGNNYVVLNSEIRIPIFSYLINSSIRSEFIKNFQVIAFTDIGTAWEGKNPYDKNNPLFTETIGQPPVTVKVDYYRNPFVTGYGFGLRSVLLGYFIRFDLGWGNDSGRVDKPMAYFSLTTDF